MFLCLYLSYFSKYYNQSNLICNLSSREGGSEHGDKNACSGHGGVLLTCLLSRLAQPASWQYSEPSAQEWHHLQWAGSFLMYHQPKRMHHRMPRGQSGGGNLSKKVHSSQITLACVKVDFKLVSTASKSDWHTTSTFTFLNHKYVKHQRWRQYKLYLFPFQIRTLFWKTSV